MPQNAIFYKTERKKMGILIQNKCSNFEEKKMKKIPLSSKLSEIYIRRPPIKKFYKLEPYQILKLSFKSTILLS